MKSIARNILLDDTTKGLIDVDLNNIDAAVLSALLPDGNDNDHSNNDSNETTEVVDVSIGKKKRR